MYQSADRLEIFYKGCLIYPMDPGPMTNLLKDVALAGAAWMYAGAIGARDES